MIISASRRTDLPAFYSDWFMNRLQEGYALVRNPMNFHQISKVKLSADVVDCIVFWTKNPLPMIGEKLEILDKLGYKYYFQFTLNPYDKDIEKNLPEKEELIGTFRQLSQKIGVEKVIWRYDPIIINDKINLDYHYKNFEMISQRLSGFTNECVISFVDRYSKISSRSADIIRREVREGEMNAIALEFSKIAMANKIKVKACSEKIDFSNIGIEASSCIDKDTIQRIIGFPINAKNDKNQRPECGCIESIDIGEYDTCIHDCIYCYANRNNKSAMDKRFLHYSKSPLIKGVVKPGDIINERKVQSLEQKQISICYSDLKGHEI